MCEIVLSTNILLNICTETSLKKELGVNVPHLTNAENLYQSLKEGLKLLFLYRIE